MSLTVLHTSDWHLGRTLYGKKRYSEFAAFLTWLIQTLQQQQVDVLIVAGDIFDTGTPSTRAQTLYYNFLRAISQTPCQHVIITAGNHDSPAFLNAPQALLRSLNIHVIGAMTECLDDELLLLHDAQNEPLLLVCAVPYLRERDLRTAEVGESSVDKERKLLSGLQNHYQTLINRAEQLRQSLPKPIPLIATGHLFTSGGQTLEGDGVRDLYIGSLGYVPASYFPDAIDYLALGHLHIPQSVAGEAHFRYSGSPIAMGFGEAKQQKTVCLIRFQDYSSATTLTPANIELLPVPCFQRLEQIRGDLNHITTRLNALNKTTESIWLEIIYEGQELINSLREHVENLIKNTPLEILRIKNRPQAPFALQPYTLGETLADLSELEVFQRCLQANAIPTTQWPQLHETYTEILYRLKNPSDEL